MKVFEEFEEGDGQKKCTEEAEKIHVKLIMKNRATIEFDFNGSFSEFLITWRILKKRGWLITDGNKLLSIRKKDVIAKLISPIQP